jgi:hypothetical protein
VSHAREGPHELTTRAGRVRVLELGRMTWKGGNGTAANAFETWLGGAGQRERGVGVGAFAWHGGWQRGVAGSGPRPSGVGGTVVVEQGRAAGRGRLGTAQLTSGTGRVRGPVSVAGCERERGERVSAAAAGRWFKAIQTVEMKFEFLQIWLIQKIPSRAPKN